MISTFLKRGAAAAVSLAVIGAGLSLGGAANAAAPGDGLIGEYLFTQIAGNAVANTATGAGAVAGATVVNGTDAQWTGDSLVFTGGAKNSQANWVELPDGILAGKTSATITTEAKIDPSMKTANHFLWNIGNDTNAAYWFATARDTTRTAITTTSGGGEVNARSTSALDANRWYSLTSVIDGAAGTITYYVDGTRVGQADTSLTPASITDQSLNTIGRSPWPDPFYKGEVAAFRVYDRALTAEEVDDVSDEDALAHADSIGAAAQSLVDSIEPVTIDDSSLVLPASGGAVSWASNTPGIAIAADGVTATAVQPAAGEPALSGTLTATATVRGITASKEVAVTVTPLAAQADDYGYLMVHFIEDSEGYAEKIYLDVSRGDNPEQWDPLNGGVPILASDLGTTGVRDPYLTYNPETQTYYIIATDLRVFGGDNGSGNCTTWCHWTKNASTKLNIWESKDLVTWGDLRQIDMAADAAGNTAAQLGMAWAPEATWVDDYYPDGRGAFVVYWASNVFPNDDPAHDTASYNRVLWGATTDFTQGSYSFGGDFVNTGGNAIDTTMIQNDGTTYRITKDNSFGNGIYMESTEAPRWWEAGTTWTTLQTKIGAVWAGGNEGGVEGPAVFKSHSDDTWYLYVDVIPTTGYRPMVTNDLDAGWSQLTAAGFEMAPSTKHGGIISLTKAQYDTVRAADATSAVSTELGVASVSQGATADAVAAALPATAAVNLAYARGTAELAVDWDLSGVDTSTAGDYTVTGVVRSLGSNLNDWAGAAGSTAWNAADKQLFSSTAIEVTSTVRVAAGEVVVPVDPGTGQPGTAGPEASTPGSTAAGDKLAATGFGASGIVSLAALLLAAGIAVVVRRRRRSA
ncbi:LamG-like jellyroll fold domain-containing protein [Agreia sp. Leaf335]|uniref:LamG-like jellyroll fold domain-containing protein n=1 Tax=Agreia sp. Leaf335 TaxID=1736340 RepID=UPI0009E8D680|nr:LamG-like jellyroll fold domain-containing protein [Agreia sp. Leaf335]